MSLLVALLAVACLAAPRPYAGAGAVAAVGQLAASSPVDTPLALLAHGGSQPALLPPAPADPSIRVILPQPPGGGAAVIAQRAATTRWFRGRQAPPARGTPPASGFASSRLPTGPPLPA